MCDCFHVVLPTWPGAPGSVSDPQLQPGGAQAESSEEHSATRGPAEEIIRPRPQGSSPVYEYPAEGAGFGVQEGARGRRRSGRRRSWWKRLSGDSQDSSVSHTQAMREAAEVTLKTEVESGASGYSVSGGGAQGIFVKHVLKDSSAAKLFSLRAGDQLLSATVFFDDIKYEDALKILQYSEPYKVQFNLRRKLPAREEEECAVHGPQQGWKGPQDKEAPDGCTETPTKTLEADGDRERLIAEPSGARGRRSQDRLSWPKFQAIRSRGTPGPRRSHSSSEAYERRDSRDASPTSTDTEALGRTPAGGGRKSFPLRLRLRRSSAQGRAGRPARGQGHAGALQQLEPGDGEPQDAESPAGGRPGSRTQAPEAPRAPTTNLPVGSSLVVGAEEPWIGEGRAAGRRQETPRGKTQEDAETHGELGARTAPGRRGEDGLDVRVSRRSLQDHTEEADIRGQPPETQVRIRPLQTPKFGFSKEKGPQTERGTSAHEERRAEQRSCGEGATLPKGSEGWWPAGLRADQPGQEEGTTHGEPETRGPEDMEEAGNGKYQSPGRTKMPRFRMPSFSWSPTKQAGTRYHRQIQEKERQPGERHEGEKVTMELDIKDKEADVEDGGRLKTDRIQRQREQTMTITEENDLCNTSEGNRMTMGVNIQVADAKLDGDLTPGDKDMAAKHSKPKMPKFKMPSFSGSEPDKPLEDVLQVSTPKMQGDLDLSPAHRDLKTPEVSIQLPSDKEQAKLDQMAMRLPEGQILEGELVGHPTGAGLKGHLPKVQMPSLRMPKVDFKGPKVDIKAPKLEAKGLKAEVDTPDLEMSLPSVEEDIQTHSAKLERDLALRDKDMSTKDSKFKMPKFKMPSFGLSAPSKPSGAAIEMSTPKQGKGLPSVHGDLKTPEVSVQLPSAEMEAKLDQVDVKISESQLSKGELEGQSTGADLKGHLPSLKIPKMDLKGPQVDIKGPKLDVKGPKAEPGTPDLEVAVPSVEVDIMASGAKLDGNLTLKDKDMSAKDSKFQMPKFKMPSFGVSVPSKPSGGALELSTPKVKGEGLPSIRGDLKTPEFSAQQPSSKIDSKLDQVALKLPEDQLPEGDLAGEPTGAGLSIHLPKVQMPSLKMPKVALKGPQVDIKDSTMDMKGSKAEAGTADRERALPSVEVTIQTPSAKLEGDLALKDQDVSTKDSKFKMPKFKMPSFGVSMPSKPSEGAVEVSVPKVQGDVDLPSVHGDLKTPEVSVQQVPMKLPQGQILEGELMDQPATADLKDHLPKVHMPSLKMPEVDFKAPQVDIKGPKLDMKGPKVEADTPDLEMSLPSVEVDIQTPSAKLDGDLALKDQDVSTKDSKFKMPKFTMPSFGVSMPSKPSEGAVEVSVPKVQGDEDLPSVQGDQKTPEVSVQLDQVPMQMPEGQILEGELMDQPARADFKGHLPKVHMPSLKMPKVDIKGPKLDMKGPKAEAYTPDLEMSLPSVEEDIQTPSAKLEGDLVLQDKDMSTKDSKLKMPKYKMPSFGVSMPSKPSEGAVELSVPKVQGDVDLPSVHGDLKTPEVSVQLPSAEMEAKLDQVSVMLPKGQVPEGELAGQPSRAGLKSHLPRWQMPSLKMPKVALKGPQVDIKDPKLDMKGPKAEAGIPDLEVAAHSVEVDIQTPSAPLEGDLALGDKDMSTKDSKLKMPKFKMPSFGFSAPGKPSQSTLEVSVPKVQGDVDLPSVQGDLETPEVSIQLPSAKVEAELDQVTVKLPEVQLPKEELVGQSTGADLKGHLPKVQMPSLKMPKVDLKGPQVDIKGPKAEAGTADLEIALPSMEVAIQTPSAKLEGDLPLKDQDVSTKDSKFKMPKFKMPSFGVSMPSKPSEGAVDVSVPKVQGDVDLPSVHGDLETPEVSVQLPSAEIEAKLDQVSVMLPEGQLPEGDLVGQLPTVQMPSLKMPKVALKGPQVDIKGPKLDMKGPKAEAGPPDLEMSLPSVKVDIQTPSAKLEGDLALREKDMSTKDSKLKMPKFKMPSFGVSVPSKPSEGAVEVSVPKVQGDVDLPSVHGDLKTPEVSVQQVPMKLLQGQILEGELMDQPATADLKDHLPKVQMPSLKMPEVDFKAPQVDIKAPKLDIKGPKTEADTPDLEMSLPSVEVDIQTPSAKLEGDLVLQDKDMSTKDRKLKMPKFKLPSFGVSMPSKPSEGAVEVSVPKVQGDVKLPSVHGDLKTPVVNIQLPSAEIEAKLDQEDMKLPEGQLPEGELAGEPTGAGLSIHLPKVQMPSLKMPKVDIKGPQVDIKGPKLDMKGSKAEAGTPDLEMSLPSVEVDIQTPSAKLEGDLALRDKDMSTKDSKFKMSKFKMPSFGVSMPSKPSEGAVEVSVLKVQGDVDLPSVQGDLETPEVSVQLSSAQTEAKLDQVAVTLPEGQLPEGDLTGQATGPGLKSHLPTVQMPSLTMPKVDLKSPQVDIKGPKLDMKGPKAEAGTPDLEVALPSLEMDIHTPSSKLEGDLALGDKDMSTKDSKLKMPKFKMPSFGVSMPSKPSEGVVEVSVPKMQGDVDLPSVQGDLETPEVNIELPSAKVEAELVTVKLPEVQLPKKELVGQSTGADLKGWLPKVQMPSLKMPKVDLKGPQVDIKGPKAEAVTPDLEIALPSMEVAIQTPSAKLEGDLPLKDQDVSTKDSKFKMPKFKMPSFRVSMPSKLSEGAVEVSVPKVQGDVDLPSVHGDLKTPEVSVQLSSAEIEAKLGQVAVMLPEGQLPEGDLVGHPPGAGLKSHLPTVQMPSLKMPKVALMGSHVDIKGPKLDMKEAMTEAGAPDPQVSLPSMEVNIEAPGAKPEKHLALKDKDMSTKDSKLKMPKFKMPSFAVSMPSKPSEGVLEVSVPKVQGDMDLPSVQGDLETPEVSIQLPSADIETKLDQQDMKLPEGQLPEGELAGQTTGAGLKSHLTTVQMPSLTIPKVDLKGPQVDIKGPKAEAGTPDLDMSLPSVEVAIQTPSAKLEGDLVLQDKDMSTKDRKLKMPKFKMPSFAVSMSSKPSEGVVEVSVPKVQGDVDLPSVQGDQKTPEVVVQLSSAQTEAKLDQVAVTLPEGQLPEGDLTGQATGAGLSIHLPTVQMPSLTMPKVDLKSPQVDIKGSKLDMKGPKAEAGTPDLEVALPSMEMDIQTPSAKLEGDLALGDKDMSTNDSKLKMPKFKMPSFGFSAPGKPSQSTLEVSVPKVQGDVDLPSVQVDLETPEVSIQLPSAKVEAELDQVTVKLPEVQLPKEELVGQSTGADLKGHLPTVQMPSLKMPKVVLMGSHVDIKGPKLDMKEPMTEAGAPDPQVSLPSMEVNIEAPGAKPEKHLALKDKDMSTKDSKLKMPKFKMPSFRVSMPSKPSEGAVEVSVPKVQGDVDLPSVHGELKTPEVNIQLPSAEIEAKLDQEDMKLPEGQLPEGELPGEPTAADLKSHLHTVQMPSLKMPKVALKGPQVDIKGPKLDMTGPKAEAGPPDLEMSLPSVKVDIQTPSAKLEGDLALREKDMSTKDSKLKMPKFKMPSFRVSMPSKPSEGAVEVSVPKVQGDVDLPSVHGDLKTPEVSVQQVPMKLPQGQILEGELMDQPATADLKDHLPKVQMPSLKMPEVDFKAPQVDIKGPKLDMKGPKAEADMSLEMSLPSVEVDIQTPSAKLEGDLVLQDKDMSTKDSKLKMPKFKMPSFGVSMPSKPSEGEVEVSVPKMQGDVDLPSVHGDLKTPVVNIQLPSAEIEAKLDQEDMKLPEGLLPEGELAGEPTGAGLSIHLPKVQMPSLKMPKVDLKGPQVDMKIPKLDMKGSKAEAGTPDLEMSLPSVEVEIQTPSAKLEGDLALRDKDMSTKDSKLKMPKFKMPFFAVSMPSKPSEGAVEVSVLKVQGDVDLPSVQGDHKTPAVSVQLPSAQTEAKLDQVAVTLPEGQLPEGDLTGQATGAGLKSHLPTVQMPSLTMPKVDLKSPQVDIKGPKLDMKGPKAEAGTPDLEIALPSMEMDIQTPSAPLEGDLALGDKDMSTKDSKLKMPKFKMPSFGFSAPGKPSQSTLEVSVPKVQGDVDLPSVQGDLETPEVSIQLPSAKVEAELDQVTVKLPEVQLPKEELVGQSTGADLKGHLPKVQMPSLKMPKVDLKGPQVDIKGPKVDIKGPKTEADTPDVDMSLPSVEVDIQTPSAKLEGDLVFQDKDMSTKDSKFKMPKFKMPSFGVSVHSKPSEGAVELSVPKVQGDVDLPSVQGDHKTPAVSVQQNQVPVQLPEGQILERELMDQPARADLKGHLPKVHMLSLKMPKVDFKAPQVDVKGPNLDMKGPKAEAGIPDLEMSLPSVEEDIQTPSAKLEGDLALRDKDMSTKDSKLKMPKFKMPSFGVSMPSKPSEGAVEVSVPKVQGDVDLPSVHGDLKTPEVSVQLPSAEMEAKLDQVSVMLPKSQVPEGELAGQPSRAGLKSHLPRWQMPSLKMPKVALKGPQVDIKSPKLDMKGPKAEAGIPDLEVAAHSVEVDIQTPSAPLEGDLALGDKDMSTKDSKLKMPKFKMPSCGVSAPGKPSQSILEVSVPKVQGDVDLPSVQGDLETPEVSIQLPSAKVEAELDQVTVKLPEVQLPKEELVGQSTGADLKGHLPKVQMPSLKMPKVDLKGPQVDIKGPKAEAGTADLEIALPSMEVAIQTPSAKLEGDLPLKDQGVSTKDSKFKMPKFKMPSFGVSMPSKPSEGAVEVSVPKVQGDVDLPSVHGDLKTTEVSVQLPSAEIEAKLDQLSVTLPEGQLSEGDLAAQPTESGLKSLLPTVQMPSLKMSKVALKGPQVDIKEPMLDKKEAMTEAGAPDPQVSLPSMEVNIEGPGAKPEKHLALKDKDMSTKDSKLKMPKFKMPSFRVSMPSKPSEGVLEVSVPKMQGDVDLPSVQGDLETPEVSIQLPSAKVEAELDQVTVKLPEVQLPKEELVGQSTGADLKGHLPKVQMPSLKMPKVDLKGPKLDIKGPKAEAGTPDLEIALPSMEVAIQTTSAKLEGDLALGDKDMSTKDSKFKMPKYKVPSFGVLMPSKPSEGAVDVSVPKVQGDVDLPSVHGDLKTPVVNIQLPSAEIEAKLDQVAVELPKGQLPEGDLAAQSARADLKGQLPKPQMPSLKMPKADLQGPQVDIQGPKLYMKGSQAEVASPNLEVSLPRMEVHIEVPHSKLEGDLVLGDKDVSTKDSKFQMPTFKRPSLGASAPDKPREAALAVSAATVRGSPGLTSVQGDLRTPAISAQLPPAKQEFEVCHVFVGLSEDHGPDISVPPSGVRISFPKFHKPKFTVRSPAVPSHRAGPPAAVPSASPGSEPWRCQCDASLASGPHSCPGADAAQQPAASSGVTTDEVPVEPGKSSPFKLPRFKLPSFHQSPKKVPVWPGSLGSSAGDPATPVPCESDGALSRPCAQLSQEEANPVVPSDQGGEKGGTKKPGFALCRVSLPKLKASKGPASAPQGDAGPALPRGPAAGRPEASGDDRARGVALGDGTQEGLSEGDGVSLRMPHVRTPSLGSAKPSPRASTAKTDRRPCDADQPLPEGHSAVTVDRKPPAPGDLPASPPCVAGTVLPPEGPVQSPCRQPEASPAGILPPEGPVQSPCRQPEASPAGILPPEGPVQSPCRQPEASPAGILPPEGPVQSPCRQPEASPAGRPLREAPSDAHERRLKMPKLRLPGFRRSSSQEQGGASGQDAAQLPLPAPDSHTPPLVPGPKVEAAVSPEPLQAGLPEPAPPSPSGSTHTPVQSQDHPGLQPPLPTAAVGQRDLPRSEAPTGLAAASLPPQPPGVGDSEPKAPEGEVAWRPPPGPKGPGSLVPEGPVKLTASCTDAPAQVSVVSVDRLWEDSVLTVSFPKLKVPRFSCPAPSSEAVFFPVVRDDTESGAWAAADRDQPGLWGARRLRADAEGPGEPPAPLSSEAPPISKVKVHIQGAPGESQEVIVCSRVTREHAGVATAAGFSTQIVRESEIPASVTQVPSYGFSLLKVKGAEPCTQASIHTGALGSGAPGGLGGAPASATPGMDPRSAEPQPDATEPFEMVSASVALSGLPVPAPEEPVGTQSADHGSDEEPAEILEFPEDTWEEAATPLAGQDWTPKEKPASRKSSGLLWSWLPSIGFSSTDETGPEPRDDTPRSTPIQTQPGARAELELPKKQEKPGWFHLPKLGFSSPTRKSKSTEAKAELAEQRHQEETTFFDARDSFSQEEEEEEEEERGDQGAGAAGAGPLAVREEQDRNAGEESGPVAK
ncbi:protein AHNAK2 [Dipodomys merriami]|uniref:protein AHNAK2 n=1 Tax=Dipodomys merriami TaxID=94247 RepID=UPI003855BF30